MHLSIYMLLNDLKFRSSNSSLIDGSILKDSLLKWGGVCYFLLVV